MYAGESAVFLFGTGEGSGFVRGKNLPVPANETLPVLVSQQTISFKDAISISASLRHMTVDLNGQHLSTIISEEKRSETFNALCIVGLRSLRDVDSSWALSLVQSFHGASKFLALEEEGIHFVTQMETQLMDRLHYDIFEGPSMQFTPYRVEAVQKSLKTMGLSFTAAHADQIAGWAYQRAIDVMRLGDADLRETMEDAERVVAKVDHVLRYGG